MPDVMPQTWFISRRVGLPLAAAATALDELLEDRRRDWASGSVSLTDRLEVWPAAALPGATRRLDARLRLGGLARPFRVELELAGWSRAESEVAIRPSRRPTSAGAERYCAGACGALDTLTNTLPSYAPAPPMAAR